MHNLLKKILQVIGRLSPAGQIMLAIVLLASVITVDVLIKSDMQISFFYLLPVLLMTWAAGGGWGGACGFVCAVVERFLLAPTDMEFQVMLWNTFIRSLTFIALVLMTSVIKEHLRKESELARTDQLTGLLNFRAFMEQASRETERLARTGGALTVAYLDCDNFKTVNDTMGHHAGDLLLSRIGTGIRNVIRTNDVAARIGGDEFALLLPSTTREGAVAALRKLINHLMIHAVNETGVTFSVGAVVCRKTPKNLEEIISRADKAMYEVKRSGKNSFTVVED